MVFPSLMAGRQCGPGLSPTPDLKAITAVRSLDSYSFSVDGPGSGFHSGCTLAYLLSWTWQLSFLTKISEVREFFPLFFIFLVMKTR